MAGMLMCVRVRVCVCVCVCCSSRVITEDYKVPDRMVGFSEYDL